MYWQFCIYTPPSIPMNKFIVSRPFPRVPIPCSVSFGPTVISSILIGIDIAGTEIVDRGAFAPATLIIRRTRV